MNKKLYVGNLDYSTTSSELKEMFSNWEITECIVIDGKGFAFITFASADQANAAKEELNEKEFRGRLMKINFAQERSDRNRNSGGFRNDYQKRY